MHSFAPWMLLLICLLGACADSPEGEGLVIDRVEVPRETKEPSADNDPELAAGVVAPPEDPEAAAESGDPLPERTFGELLDEVKRLVNAEDYDLALARINAVRKLSPPRPIAAELEVLKVEVKRHLLQSMYVEALVLLDKNQIPVGDPITGVVALVNLSPARLIIPSEKRTAHRLPADALEQAGTALRPDPSNPRTESARLAPVIRESRSISTVYFEVDYVEHGPDGVLFKDQLKWSQQVGEDIVLEPGQRHEWKINLDSLAFRPNRVAYRTYHIAAKLFPSDVRIADESFTATLAFRPRTCHVFPRNFEHLRDDPMARLEQALKVDAAQHIPVIAALTAPEDRGAAIRRLGRALRGEDGSAHDGALRVAACVALQILTGEELPARPEAWIDRLEENPSWATHR